jgi:hypothetical protein
MEQQAVIMAEAEEVEVRITLEEMVQLASSSSPILRVEGRHQAHL